MLVYVTKHGEEICAMVDNLVSHFHQSNYTAVAERGD